MKPIVGREPVFAMEFGSVWGTAVQVGAGNGVLPLSDGLLAGHSVVKHNDESLPLPFVQTTEEGIETIAGDLVKNMRYQGDERFLAAVMGDPQAKVAGTADQTMIILLATVLQDIFYTWATNLTDTEVNEVPSVKANGLAISGEMGSPLQLTINQIGNLLRKAGDTGMINLLADLANVTIPDAVKDNRIVMNQRTEFLINDETGIALAAGVDDLGIQAFNFAFNRGMETFAQSDTVDVNSVPIAEPVDNAFPIPALDISIPRYNAANAFAQNLKLGGKYKAELNFYGAIIPTTAIRYKLSIKWPRLVVTSIAPATSGPGKIPGDVSFSANQVETIPAGFTDDKPFSMTTINQEVAVPF